MTIDLHTTHPATTAIHEELVQFVFQSAVTPTARMRFAPAATATPIATRSAQLVRP